jgi:hypothetical protein
LIPMQSLSSLLLCIIRCWLLQKCKEHSNDKILLRTRARLMSTFSKKVYLQKLIRLGLSFHIGPCCMHMFSGL